MVNWYGDSYNSKNTISLKQLFGDLTLLATEPKPDWELPRTYELWPESWAWGYCPGSGRPGLSRPPRKGPRQGSKPPESAREQGMKTHGGLGAGLILQSTYRGDTVTPGDRL